MRDERWTGASVHARTALSENGHRAWFKFLYAVDKIHPPFVLARATFGWTGAYLINARLCLPGASLDASRGFGRESP